MYWQLSHLLQPFASKQNHYYLWLILKYFINENSKMLEIFYPKCSLAKLPGLIIKYLSQRGFIHFFSSMTIFWLQNLFREICLRILFVFLNKQRASSFILASPRVTSHVAIYCVWRKILKVYGDIGRKALKSRESRILVQLISNFLV